MTIPDKYLRKAIIALTATVTPIPMYDKLVPKDATIPAKRFVITGITKTQAETNKCGHNWNCTVNIDAISEMPLGYINTADIDDMEELLSNLIDLQSGDMNCDPFTILNTTVLTPVDMSYQTDTKSIGRKVLRYQFILNGLYN